MARYVRNSAVLAKIESVYGTDPVPTGGANAMLVSNQSNPKLVNNLVDRALLRSYFGGSEQLVGNAFVEISDIIFAVDSVPAIFALTKEPLIVFTSNVFVASTKWNSKLAHRK